MQRGNGNGSGPEVFETDQYFYHPDHLGSSSYVTDVDGEIFQHLEYFPFGETWVEESSNTQRTPYLFTGKELDEETGLYYFGARYYDPRTSVWQSPDPILASYMAGGPNGGVFEPVNLAVLSYARQNPVAYSDPDGNAWGLIGKAVKVIIRGGDIGATLAGAAQDVSTIFSGDATILQRVGATASLATEVFSPVSARDVRAGANAAESAMRRGGGTVDTASDVRRAEAAAQLANNRRAGAEFEEQVLGALGHTGAGKNTQGITIPITRPDGSTVNVTTIPDAWGRSAGGMLEVKNVRNLSMSDQFRAQVTAATASGEP